MRLDSEGILEDVLGDRQTRFFSDLEHLESVASAEIDERKFVGAEVHGTVFIPVTVMVPPVAHVEVIQAEGVTPLG
jgi:hypothetical protein